MKNVKRILIVLLTLPVLAAGVGYYMYNKPTESLKNMKVQVSMTSDALFTAFEQDETAANKAYLDKVVEVKGKIQSLNSDTSGVSVSLNTTSGMFGVICKFENKETDINQYQVGQEVKLKGICTGYLMDVVLVRCVPVE
ncbi:MAG: hypothetical protein JNL88_04150 [Bacteroidia bacterium]|nr:hypothetical protein [Bacteroidia bacterium]